MRWRKALSVLPKRYNLARSAGGRHSCRRLLNKVRAAGGTLLPMPKSAVTLESVWKTGLTFPGVEESTTFGAPALKVRGKLMTCVPRHKTAEPGSILIRMDRNDRPALLAESPNLYYAPEHYLNYDSVLVRLAYLTPELLHDLLAMAHKFVTRKTPKR